jgi:hypothetical protein
MGELLVLVLVLILVLVLLVVVKDLASSTQLPALLVLLLWLCILSRDGEDSDDVVDRLDSPLINRTAVGMESFVVWMILLLPLLLLLLLLVKWLLLERPFDRHPPTGDDGHNNWLILEHHTNDDGGACAGWNKDKTNSVMTRRATTGSGRSGSYG